MSKVNTFHEVHFWSYADLELTKAVTHLHISYHSSHRAPSLQTLIFQKDLYR